MYDLIANVTHESVAGTTRDKANTVWKVHLRAGTGGGENDKWFQIQDLIVEEVRKEMIFLGESVLQVRRFVNSNPSFSNVLNTYHADMGTASRSAGINEWKGCQDGG